MRGRPSPSSNTATANSAARGRLWWDNPATGWEPITEPTAVYNEATHCVKVTATATSRPSIAQLSDPRHVGGPVGDRGIREMRAREARPLRRRRVHERRLQGQQGRGTAIQGQVRMAARSDRVLSPKARATSPMSGCTEDGLEKKGKGEGQVRSSACSAYSEQRAHRAKLEAGRAANAGMRSEWLRQERIQAPNDATESVTFTGCKQSDTPCSSGAGAPTEGTIVSEPLESYTYEEGEGYLEALNGSPFMQFSCSGARFTLTGAVAGPLSTSFDMMTTSGTVSFAEDSGGQTLEVIDEQGRKHEAFLTSTLTTRQLSAGRAQNEEVGPALDVDAPRRARRRPGRQQAAAKGPESSESGIRRAVPPAA